MSKKLVFIDNDALVDKDAERAILALEVYADFKIDSFDRGISNFHLLPKEEKQELIYSGKNAIFTWSGYNPKTGSFQQLHKFLIGSSRNTIKDLVYVDCTGYLCRALESMIENSSADLYHILQAIETNYLFTLVNNFTTDSDLLEDENLMIGRVRLDFKGAYKKCLKIESGYKLQDYI